MTKNNESIEKITEKELSSNDMQDRLLKLEKDREKNKKIIEEYKEREKATARALVLYERKIKFLKKQAIDEALAIAKFSESTKNLYSGTCENLINSETKQQFKTFCDKYDEIAEKIYKLCDNIEENSGITNEDRAFISNKPQEAKAPAKNDINSRFNRLKQEFNQKIGTSVLRKPGRPKKSEQSIVSDIGLGKKPEKRYKEQEEAKEKLNKIFYDAPTGGANAVPVIPKTEDSIFDFEEALNPNISLKDIMADLMEERKEEPVRKYSKLPDANKTIERKPIENFDSAKERRSRIERLEAGIFQTPIFKEKKEKEEVQEAEPKPTFERRFMPFSSIMEETEK